MNTKIELTCPYCGNRFSIWRKIERQKTMFITSCDIDESDGCYRFISVIVNMKAVVRTFSMAEFVEGTTFGAPSGGVSWSGYRENGGARPGV